VRQQIGQQIIIGIQGLTLSRDEADFIIKNNIGGVILFKRNLESPEQIYELTREIQSLRTQMADKAPLFISIDMEGGRVQRLPPPFTQWPAAAALGKIDSPSVAFRFAQAMGEELRAVGINLNYAPCIDVLTNPQNTVIGDRALSTSAETVTRLGSALVRGYIKSGILPCAKHFPGHGNTLLDSHEALPIEDKTLEELEQVELEPFKKAFRARIDLVMPTHIKYPKIDPDWPASLSEIFLRKILRERMRYRNLVITDDLDMKALTLNYDKSTIAVRALAAGANILLYCNEPDSPPTALEAIERAIKEKTLDPAIVADNRKRILELKKASLSPTDLPSLEEMSRIVGHPDHLRLAKAIAEGAVPADLISQTT